MNSSTSTTAPITYKTENVIKVQHSLIEDRLASLRDKNTDHTGFRILLEQLSLFLAVEVTKDLPLIPREIETPVCKATFSQLASKNNMTLVPILRAGLGMVEGFLKVIPEAKVGHIGVARDEETGKLTEYYLKLPKGVEEDLVILLDPMLSTGSSLSHSISRLYEVYNVKNLVVVCLVAAPKGLSNLTEKFPDLKIYTAAVDERINEVGYITPGLGDAGDRINGTFTYDMIRERKEENKQEEKETHNAASC